MNEYVLHWPNGAYLTTAAGSDFDKLYAELCNELGPPISAMPSSQNETDGKW